MELAIILQARWASVANEDNDSPPTSLIMTVAVERKREAGIAGEMACYDPSR